MSVSTVVSAYCTTPTPKNGSTQPTWLSSADNIAAVPGLRWKVWIINEDQSEAGGLYLFEDAAAMQTFLESPLAAQVTNHPALSDFSVKPFDVMEDLTEITRGPIQAAVSR